MSGSRNNGKDYNKLYVNPCKLRGEAEGSECNPITFNWISIKFAIFANGLRKLFPRHIRI